MAQSLPVSLTLASAMAVSGCMSLPTEGEKLMNYPKAVADCEIEVKRLKDNRFLYVSGVTLASLFVVSALNDPDSSNDAYYSPLLGAGFGADIYVETKTDIDCVLEMRPEGMSEQQAENIIKGGASYNADAFKASPNPRINLPALNGIK